MKLPLIKTKNSKQLDFPYSKNWSSSAPSNYVSSTKSNESMYVAMLNYALLINLNRVFLSREENNEFIIDRFNANNTTIETYDSTGPSISYREGASISVIDDEYLYIFGGEIQECKYPPYLKSNECYQSYFKTKNIQNIQLMKKEEEEDGAENTAALSARAWHSATVLPQVMASEEKNDNLILQHNILLCGGMDMDHVVSNEIGVLSMTCKRAIKPEEEDQEENETIPETKEHDEVIWSMEYTSWEVRILFHLN